MLVRVDHCVVLLHVCPWSDVTILTHNILSSQTRSQVRDSLHHWRLAVHCRSTFLGSLYGIEYQELGTAKFIGSIHGLELRAQ